MALVEMDIIIKELVEGLYPPHYFGHAGVELLDALLWAGPWDRLVAIKDIPWSHRLSSAHGSVTMGPLYSPSEVLEQVNAIINSKRGVE